MDIVALVVALWLTTRPPPPTHSQRTTPLAATLTKHKARLVRQLLGHSTSVLPLTYPFPLCRMSLSISALLLAFYIMTWLFGLLAIYGNEFSDSASQTLESIFAILYATMGVFVFIVMTLNSKVATSYIKGCFSILTYLWTPSRFVRPARHSSSTKTATMTHWSPLLQPPLSRLSYTSPLGRIQPLSTNHVLDFTILSVRPVYGTCISIQSTTMCIVYQ